MENSAYKLKNQDWFDPSKKAKFGLPVNYGRLINVNYEIKKNLFRKKIVIVEGYKVVKDNELSPRLKITQDYETGRILKEKYLPYDCWS